MSYLLLNMFYYTAVIWWDRNVLTTYDALMKPSRLTGRTRNISIYPCDVLPGKVWWNKKCWRTDIHIELVCFFHWWFVSTHCTVKYCVTLQGSYRFFTSKFKNVSQTFQRPKRYFQRPVLLISSSKINLKYDNKCYQIIIQFLKIPSLLVQSTILH